MGWRYRKSINLGCGFRINLSKSGIGYSYQQERSFDTLEGAATNPNSMQGGLMGAGIGLGMGVGVGGAIGQQFGGLTQNLNINDTKECPKCKRILDVSSFKDDTLISGMGKICSDCKNKNTSSHIVHSNATNCPLCGSRLVIRRGQYGSFLGCSRYPYCKYTRKL